jgi:type II secretory pathway component PulF
MGKSSMNLKSYRWQARSHTGQTRQGMLTANSYTQAKIKLVTEGLTEITLRRQYRASYKTTHLTRLQFYRQLALLLTSGVPLHQAVELLLHLLPTSLQQLPHLIHKGIPLSQALAELHPRWPALAIQLMRLGEQTGQLDDILQALADSEQQTRHIITRLRNALFYPAVLMGIAFVLCLGFLLVIVPQFAALFAKWATSLPVSTQWVIAGSQWLQAYGLWLAGGLLTGSFVLHYILRQQNSAWPQHLLRKIPWLKQLVALHDYLHILHTLRLTYQAGLPLVEGVQLLSHTLEHTHWFTPLQQASQRMQQGMDLTGALRQTTALPATLLHMLHIGEQSGQLSVMLATASQWYQAQFNQAITRLEPLLEPCLLLIIGAVIGGLLVILYLPMFQMGQLI